MSPPFVKSLPLSWEKSLALRPKCAFQCEHEHVFEEEVEKEIRR